MSLDCYPIVQLRTIGLSEQPMAVDVAYEQNLLITVIDGCQTVVVYELEGSPSEQATVLGTFSLGHNVVIDRVAYCETGDYIACVGHKNGIMALYAVFNWRNSTSSSPADCGRRAPLRLEELDLNATTTPIDEVDRGHKLESVDVCQRTGNLAASYGDLVVIYQYNSDCELAARDENDTFDDRQSSSSSSQHSDDDLDKLNELSLPSAKQFVHIISVKLAIWAHTISLAENYLSLTTSDHVQVLKLELLTLQIQSDAHNDLNGNLLANKNSNTNQTNRSSSGSSGESRNPAPKSHRPTGRREACRNRRRLLASTGEEVNGVSTTTASSSAPDTDSIMSDSNNSTTTNFSAFNTTATTITETSACLQAHPSGSEPSDNELDNCATQLSQLDQTNNDSDMSIITMNNVNQNGTQALLDQAAAAAAAAETRASGFQDDCITWNLNTKKLVKLPTLMHNTSSDLSSYHVCHPLELLGPASESIACRVFARLYSADFCQNQLEPVVLLCKQFDCDRDPVKAAHLHLVYLSSMDDQRRLSRSVANVEPSTLLNDGATTNQQLNSASCADAHTGRLLKSTEHELIASVTCFVATLTTCFVYSLHGKKVSRIQTITHPDLCLDLRPDLLNVYLLTPVGLQICSTGLCDSTFRYDWSSSADLNLSFVACNRTRALTTSDYIVMVSSSPPAPNADRQLPDCRSSSDKKSCFIEVWQKPNLTDLFKRVVHTCKRCQSISVRSNLLTYLHACAQLALINEQRDKRTSHQESMSSMEMLKNIAIMLCKQLLQKKQTNVITNSRIDKVIKHLLDISHCDLNVLMSRHIEQLNERREGIAANGSGQRDKCQSYSGSLGERSYENEDDDDEMEDDQPLDSDYELLTIYLRYSKYNPLILAYLQANSSNELVSARIISYMFDNNPRLLIKCAQRFAKDNCRLQDQMLCLNLLVERLKQLAELDSTGINRATVLFTLANLYNATDNQRERSLQTLSQIKPLSHLAITMCSNHEIIGRPMAKLVAENYPQVFKLFLSQLGKRDANAAQEFAKVQEEAQSASDEQRKSAQQVDLVMRNFGANFRLSTSTRDGQALEGQEPDEDELFDQKLRLIAEIEPVELADLFLEHMDMAQAENQEKTGLDGEEDETVEAYMRASIGLLESQLILARLCESSR